MHPLIFAVKKVSSSVSKSHHQLPACFLTPRKWTALLTKSRCNIFNNPQTQYFTIYSFPRIYSEFWTKFNRNTFWCFIFISCLPHSGSRHVTSLPTGHVPILGTLSCSASPSCRSSRCCCSSWSSWCSSCSSKRHRSHTRSRWVFRFLLLHQAWGLISSSSILRFLFLFVCVCVFYQAAASSHHLRPTPPRQPRLQERASRDSRSPSLLLPSLLHPGCPCHPLLLLLVRPETPKKTSEKCSLFIYKNPQKY